MKLGCEIAAAHHPDVLVARNRAHLFVDDVHVSPHESDVCAVDRLQRPAFALIKTLLIPATNGVGREFI